MESSTVKCFNASAAANAAIPDPKQPPFKFSLL